MKSNFKHNLSRLRKMVNPEQTRADHYRTIGTKTPTIMTEDGTPRRGKTKGWKKSPATVREQATDELRAKIERLTRRRKPD